LNYVVSLQFLNDKQRILQNVTPTELLELYSDTGYVHFRGENDGFSVNMRNVMHWDYQVQKEETDIGEVVDATHTQTQAQESD
jgi:hypothetical protein